MSYSKNKNPFLRSSQFLFVVMGAIIAISSILVYLIGSRYIEESELVAFIVIVINFILIIVTFVILKGFEKVAEASEIKSNFLSAVSHQLRSPIINLKWALDILEEEEDIEKQKKYIKNLKENVKRITELTENFFIASRIEEKELSSEKEEVDFQKIVEETISRFKIFTEDSDIKIVFNKAEKLPSLSIDKSQIKLIIENLIDNAICYSKKGGEINISVEYKENRIYFSIKDSGIGIPKEEQKHIFDKFFRAKNSKEKNKKGIGLGLFIVKSIIEKEKGKVWFQSELGKGTTFFFYLPVA